MRRVVLRQCRATRPLVRPRPLPSNLCPDRLWSRRFQTYTTNHDPPGPTSCANTEDGIIQLLRARPRPSADIAISSSYDEYTRHAGKVLDHVLAYEAYPTDDRRAGRSSEELVQVVHAVDSGEYVVSSGFVVDGGFVISCAHTLEQIEHRYPSSPKRSYILVNRKSGVKELLPIVEIVSSSPRTDIIVGRYQSFEDDLRTLPVSPYPMYRDQEVLVHLYGHTRSGGSWGHWVSGIVLGYRGHAWEEVEPGTSSALPYILISTLPSSGSSGGPIVDASSGAVVGMISGRRMDNRVEKERGWGSSAESIFELFSLPGFISASARRKRLQQSS